MDFFDNIGPVAIGTRLRAMAETITRSGADIYALYDVDIKPKWFPVVMSLADGSSKTIGEMAANIGQTHASISTMVKEMKKAGVIEDAKDNKDQRQTMVQLSPKGVKIVDSLSVQLKDVEAAVSDILSESEHNLWEALADWERLLSKKSLLERTAEIKNERESRSVEIVPFSDEYAEAYFDLNRQWIERYWQLEPHDFEQLSNPQSNILDKGGYIFVALLNGNPVGVCTLVKMYGGTWDYEIAKLAVAPHNRQIGIGAKLFQAAIDKAKDLGAKKLFIESNTRLRPAISLYRKFGFKELSEQHPAYERGNIQMELTLKYT